MSTLSVLRPIVKLLQVGVGSVSISGLEHLPDSKPYMLVLNHMSKADPPLVLLAYKDAHIRFFAGEKWKRHKIFGPILGWAGAVYINRGEVDRQALRGALNAIQDGHVFALAPEGKRSKVGALIKAKDGVAYLAARANIPIVPMGIINSDIIGANLKRLRRTKLQLIVGKQFKLPELAHRPKSAELSAYTHFIMIHIAAILPKRYWGYYAESFALKAFLAGEDPWPLCLEQESHTG